MESQTVQTSSGVPPMGIRAYARRRGCSAPSVLRAIARGRLEKSLVYVGAVAQIADPDLADEEWARNTDLSRAPSTVKEKADQPKQPVTTEPVTGVLPPVTPPMDAPLTEGMSLSSAAAAEKLWKARQAELDYRRDAGQLVSAAAVAQTWSAMVGEMRAAVLGVPSKLKGARPETTREQLAALDGLLCQALESLAPKGDR